MKCLRCNKECLESELKDGLCQECITKNKNNAVNPIIVSSIISIFVSVVLSLIIGGWTDDNIKISDFKVESFNMETEKSSYTYSEDSYSYDGEGTIVCEDEKTDYLVLIEEKNTTDGTTDYNYVIVHDGVGKFRTYDSSFTGTNEKPNYEFNILGFTSFKK